ncbi:unnamed protein product [Vitrella brassicaformis CCMP3155]|uniref:RNase NYN domain-containing protein n=3 Tax=Vitrella brassicaformis TaxID=1169539 RepID=A0A0G4EU30_VITBC|nr:unnamed protein product [Vitrella brassicaformis CCMP3155]|eukprot:CEM02143.1 unnamed protein product [Vitrella brassicaformis CCMP3155]
MTDRTNRRGERELYVPPHHSSDRQRHDTSASPINGHPNVDVSSSRADHDTRRASASHGIFGRERQDQSQTLFSLFQHHTTGGQDDGAPTDPPQQQKQQPPAVIGAAPIPFSAQLAATGAAPSAAAAAAAGGGGDWLKNWGRAVRDKLAGRVRATLAESRVLPKQLVLLLWLEHYKFIKKMLDDIQQRKEAIAKHQQQQQQQEEADDGKLVQYQQSYSKAKQRLREFLETANDFYRQLVENVANDLTDMGGLQDNDASSSCSRHSLCHLYSQYGDIKRYQAVHIDNCSSLYQQTAEAGQKPSVDEILPLDIEDDARPLTALGEAWVFYAEALRQYPQEGKIWNQLGVVHGLLQVDIPGVVYYRYRSIACTFPFLNHEFLIGTMQKMGDEQTLAAKGKLVRPIDIFMQRFFRLHMMLYEKMSLERFAEHLEPCIESLRRALIGKQEAPLNALMLLHVVGMNISALVHASGVAKGLHEKARQVEVVEKEQLRGDKAKATQSQQQLENGHGEGAPEVTGGAEAPAKTVRDIYSELPLELCTSLPITEQHLERNDCASHALTLLVRSLGVIFESLTSPSSPAVQPCVLGLYWLRCNPELFTSVRRDVVRLREIVAQRAMAVSKTLRQTHQQPESLLTTGWLPEDRLLIGLVPFPPYMPPGAWDWDDAFDTSPPPAPPAPPPPPPQDDQQAIPSDADLSPPLKPVTPAAAAAGASDEQPVPTLPPGFDAAIGATDGGGGEAASSGPSPASSSRRWCDYEDELDDDSDGGEIMIWKKPQQQAAPPPPLPAPETLPQEELPAANGGGEHPSTAAGEGEGDASPTSMPTAMNPLLFVNEAAQAGGGAGGHGHEEEDEEGFGSPEDLAGRAMANAVVSSVFDSETPPDDNGHDDIDEEESGDAHDEEGEEEETDDVDAGGEASDEDTPTTTTGSSSSKMGRFFFGRKYWHKVVPSHPIHPGLNEMVEKDQAQDVRIMRLYALAADLPEVDMPQLRQGKRSYYPQPHSPMYPMRPRGRGLGHQPRGGRPKQKRAPHKQQARGKGAGRGGGGGRGSSFTYFSPHHQMAAARGGHPGGPMLPHFPPLQLQQQHQQQPVPPAPQPAVPSPQPFSRNPFAQGVNDVVLVHAPGSPVVSVMRAPQPPPPPPSTSSREVAPLIVLDASNIAMRHGGVTQKKFSVRGLQIVIEHFQGQGHRVVAFLPEYLSKFKEVGEAKRLVAMGMGSASKVPDDVKLLQQLIEKGSVVVTPPQDYDDSYCIGYAQRHDGCIVTNDMYRDWVEKVSPDNRLKAKQWTKTHLISYTWVQDEFVPNPDFQWPPPWTGGEIK